MTESVPGPRTTPTSNDYEQDRNSLQWEYRVMHINMNPVKQEDLPKQANPEVASKKLQGSLSPDFIRKEFPGMYTNPGQPRRTLHPAEQLQNFLNEMGREFWELVEISSVGPLQMFFFKRPVQSSVPLKTDRENLKKTTDDRVN